MIPDKLYVLIVPNMVFLLCLWLLRFGFGRLLVLGLKKGDYLHFSNVCPFNYTAFVASRKVGIPYTGLTTPVRWLSLLQLTGLSRSTIVVQSKVFGGVFVLSLYFLKCSVRVGTFVIGPS